ncbi:hypothetical protein CDL15_Pgr004444 [Punica granatum]|uniref:Uncharacterized protein n=1 Tax=Punica granatum TaxID=22663 RepID=A0A218XGF7_PUNGR|nr:hypothetical protein CDL15_Pgr004444 [Punica granatum]
MVEGSDWSGEDSESEFGSDARNETVSDDSEDAACEPGPDECGEEDDEEELMAQLLDRIESGNILNPRDRESQNGGLIMNNQISSSSIYTWSSGPAVKPPPVFIPIHGINNQHMTQWHYCFCSGSQHGSYAFASDESSKCCQQFNSSETSPMQGPNNANDNSS